MSNCPVGSAEAALQRVREVCETPTGVGWHEWLMPGVSTTHITSVSEDGYIYSPEGESEADFLLASAEGRAYRLVRVRDILRAFDGDDDE